MTELILLTGFGALAVTAIGATIAATLRDGYRRMPLARPLREYERNDHYRA